VAREVEAFGLQNLALNGNSIQAIEHQRVGLKSWTSWQLSQRVWHIWIVQCPSKYCRYRKPFAICLLYRRFSAYFEAEMMEEVLASLLLFYESLHQPLHNFWKFLLQLIQRFVEFFWSKIARFLCMVWITSQTYIRMFYFLFIFCL
jgi:hypothetical protein